MTRISRDALSKELRKLLETAQKYHRSIETYQNSIDTLHTRLERSRHLKQAGKLTASLASEVAGLADKQAELAIVSRRIEWIKSEMDVTPKGNEIIKAKTRLASAEDPVIKAKLSGELMALRLLPAGESSLCHSLPYLTSSIEHFQQRFHPQFLPPPHHFNPPVHLQPLPPLTPQYQQMEEQFHYPHPHAPPPQFTPDIYHSPCPPQMMPQHTFDMFCPPYHPVQPLCQQPMMSPPPPPPPQRPQFHPMPMPSPPPAFRQPVSRAVRIRKPLNSPPYTGGFCYPAGYGPEGLLKDP